LINKKTPLEYGELKGKRREFMFLKREREKFIT